MDPKKMELLTSFLVDFLEYLRASEGERLMHKKVSYSPISDVTTFSPSSGDIEVEFFLKSILCFF